MFQRLAFMFQPSNRFDVEQVRFEDYSVIVLTVKRATFADDGTFICEAANIAERVTQPFSLRVFGNIPLTLLPFVIDHCHEIYEDFSFGRVS